MQIVSWLIGAAVALFWLIVGQGILIALERRNIRPAEAIGRFLSPASTEASFAAA